MLVDELRRLSLAFQDHGERVEPFHLAAKLDAAREIERDRDVLLALAAVNLTRAAIPVWRPDISSESARPSGP